MCDPWNFWTCRQCPGVRFSSSKARDAARAFRPGDTVSGYTVQKVSSTSWINYVLKKVDAISKPKQARHKEQNKFPPRKQIHKMHTHKHTNACMHAHIHTQTHTRIHTHTHTHTHAQTQYYNNNSETTVLSRSLSVYISQYTYIAGELRF